MTQQKVCSHRKIEHWQVCIKEYKRNKKTKDVLLEKIHEIKLGNTHNREKKNTPEGERKSSEETSTTKEGNNNAQIMEVRLIKAKMNQKKVTRTDEIVIEILAALDDFSIEKFTGIIKYKTMGRYQKGHITMLNIRILMKTAGSRIRKEMLQEQFDFARDTNGKNDIYNKNNMRASNTNRKGYTSMLHGYIGKLHAFREDIRIIQNI